MLVRLADWCYRRRRLVVVAWIVALVGAFALAGAFGGELKQDYLQPGSESKAAADTLEESFPQKAGDTIQIVVHSEDGVTSPEVQARAEAIFADVADSDHVVGVASPFAAGGAAQISEDGTTAYAEVALDKRDSDFTPAEAKALVEPVLAAGDDSLQVEVGGPVAALSQTAPFGTEGIGLLAAAIILLFTFGSAVAMGLPLITAVFGLGTAIALGEVLRRVVDVPDWAPPTAAMVGLGVGIDYALLIVTRFRSNLADGQEPRRATVSAIATAGRAVVFAGLVVIVSMLGILLVGLAVPERLRLHRVAGRAARHDRLADAAAGTARVRRPQHRAPARAVRGQEPARLRHLALVPVEPLHPAPAVVRRDRRPRGPAGAGRARSWASGSGSPTPRTTRRATPPTRPTACSPTGSDPASRRRWCSPSRAPRTASC